MKISTYRLGNRSVMMWLGHRVQQHHLVDEYIILMSRLQRFDVLFLFIFSGCLTSVVCRHKKFEWRCLAAFLADYLYNHGAHF